MTDPLEAIARLRDLTDEEIAKARLRFWETYEHTGNDILAMRDAIASILSDLTPASRED